MHAMIGPLNKIPALYARGRWRFALTRGAAYATAMVLGLFTIDTISRGPMSRNHLLYRFAAYGLTQFILGFIIALFIWRAVERVARLQEQQRGRQAS